MTQALELAEAFLQEAVFRSRAEQATSTALAHLAAHTHGDKQRQCGLGTEATIALDLTPRAAELARQLWPAGLDAERANAVRAVLAQWIERQDQLDRERNHFLKAFRHAHGFDRRAYSAEQLAQYEAGLARVNAGADAERRAAAARLLA